MAPTLTSLSPTSGPASGLNNVTLTGTGFVGIVTAVRFGTTSTTFTIDSSSQITAIAPPGSGTVQVTVSTGAGTSNGLPYTYAAVPTLTSISPTQGPTTGGTTVTLTGTNFTGVTAVRFGATPATGFTVNSATQITATAPPGTGTVQVTVTNGAGTSNGASFTYVVVPALSAVNPNQGPASGLNSVTLTGTGFAAVTAVRFGSTAATFTIDSSSQITAIAPPGTGTVQVTVTTTAGTSNGLPYTYAAVPTLTSISPTQGPTTGGTTVTLTGTNFTGVTAVRFGATPATGFTVNSGTQITATAPPGTGTVQVTVTTAGGTSNGLIYTYIAVPTLLSVSPAAGPVAGGTTVTLVGADLSGATAVTFGATPATSFTVVSGTQITAVAPAGTGIVQITVTTVGGTSNGVAYTYVAVPTIGSPSPAAGPTAGGTSVSIPGAALTTTQSVTFGGVPAAFTVISDMQVTAVTPPRAAGAVNVVVTTSGGSATATGAFTYIAPPEI
jgi:hypothetical protein